MVSNNFHFSLCSLTFNIVSRKTSNKKKNAARAGNAEKTSDKIASNDTEKINNVDKPSSEKPVEQIQNAAEGRALKSESGKAKPTPKPKPPTKTTKPKTKPTSKPSTNKKPVPTKNKTKTTVSKSKPRAKGTLYGLSSLRRTGDVTVSILSDHTTVKSNFAVGPLILRVEKEVCNLLVYNRKLNE